MIWSFGAGLVLYGALRLIFRKRISALISPLVKNVNLDLVDEVGYRAVSIGFPVFTLGALVFAMIWAQLAWTRFWGWDPKEVWALITFYFTQRICTCGCQEAGMAKSPRGLPSSASPLLCLT